MISYNKGSYGNAERILLFLCGVFISSVVSTFISAPYSWNYLFLFILMAILVVSVVLILSVTNKNVDGLIEKIESNIKYVEEEFRQDEGVEYKGAIFKEIAQLVRNAKSEILVLGTPFGEKEKHHKTAEHPSREEYLIEIEKNIRRHKEKGFRYVRIQQVPLTNAKLPMLQHCGKITYDHCRRALEITKKENLPYLSLHIMKVTTRRMTSFMIVDRRNLVIEIDGYDEKGKTFMDGGIFIEDRGGRIISRFVSFFERIEHRALDLSYEEFPQLKKVEKKSI